MTPPAAPSGYERLDTARLVLRRPLAADVDGIFHAYASDAAATRYLSWPRHHAIAQAMLDSGIRGVLSKYVMDVTGYAKDKSALHPGVWENSVDSLRQAGELIDRWHGAGGGRLQVWYSPRSVGGVSKELFIKISRLAREKGVGITTVSEAQK